MSTDTTPPPGSKLLKFRNAFFSGVLLLAPLVVTVWAFRTFIDLVGGSFRPLYEDYLPDTLQRLPFFWDLVATGVVILFVTALGYLSNYFLGKFFLGVGERVIRRIPGVGAVYNSVKQVVATFGAQNRSMFTKVVLVQFPRQGIWSMGFLTNTDQGEPQQATGSEIWTVFVPTAPNPTSGFMVMFPRQDVKELTMSVGDGMKMIVSGGAVLPPWPEGNLPEP
jgi:uncharacterized membrane protein